jgi:hypothetical protein
MSRREVPVFYVEQRYRLLEELVRKYDLTIDTGVSRWNEQERHDPLRGYVLLQCVHPLEQRSDDESDQVVRIKLEEWWYRGDTEGAEQVQGNTLIECHYTGVAGVGTNPTTIRYCYAPDHHPEEPMHWHPRDDPDEPPPHSFCSPSDTFAHFENLVYAEATAGRLA